jgi:aspartyl-tRNA(Asn)/glutamyl-tRNA(Gln) amidotransferase subunit B
MIQRLVVGARGYNISLLSRSRPFAGAVTVTASSSSSPSELLSTTHSETARANRRNISSSVPCRAKAKWSVDSDTGVVSFEGKPRFQTVIGLEIHAQLDISTKLFSGCPVQNSKSSLTNSNPNTSVWPMDVGIPGFLPRLSVEAVKAAVLSAGAMKCIVPTMSRFERKHYFYADSPLGYQITQQRWPLARDGIVTCRPSSNSNHSKKKKKKKSKKSGSSSSDYNNDTFRLRIERVQLEQDTGKTLADAYTNPITNRKESLVDFNRAGRALIEVVSHPDLRSSTQAAIAVETLRSLFKHIGTCDGKMEEGSLRCDLNVSIAPIVEGEVAEFIINNNSCDDVIIARTGNRVEVKNLNSVRQVQQAADYEALRQSKAILLDDSPTSQETRTFDVKRNCTVVLRTKEGAKDYRFMPEPDLPPLILNEEALGEGIKDVQTFLVKNLPELPDGARQRLQDEYGLSDYLAGVITSDPPAIAFFDESVHEAKLQLADVSDREKRKIPETVANLLCNELFALVREFEMQRLIEEGLVDTSTGGGGASDSSIRFSRVSGYQLGEVVALVLEGVISNTMAKQLLRVVYSDAKMEAESESEPSLLASSPATRSPRNVAQERGFQLIIDAEELAILCRDAIDSSPKEIERYKLGGKFATKITKFLLGKAMGASRGNAHPERLNEVLTELLKEVVPLAEEA